MRRRLDSAIRAGDDDDDDASEHRTRGGPRNAPWSGSADLRVLCLALKSIFQPLSELRSPRFQQMRRGGFENPEANLLNVDSPDFSQGLYPEKNPGQGRAGSGRTDLDSIGSAVSA